MQHHFMRRYFICLLLLAQTARAQQSKTGYAGIIADARTHRQIEGAMVQSRQTNIALTSNEQGRFYFASRLHASDSLHISALGYVPKAIACKDLREDLNIHLEPDVVNLREMTLSASCHRPLHNVGQLDIKIRGLNNAQELLRMIPGLFIGQHAGGGKAEQMFLRGFDIDHGTDVAITTDGIPVNIVSHAHGQGYADLHFIIPEVVDQVRFGKGPYAADKGNFATAGHVALQSKERLDNSLIKLEGGQFNTLRTLAMVQLFRGRGRQKRGLYVAAGHLQSRGFFDAPQDFSRTNLFARYQQMLGKRHQLDASIATFYSKWNASGQIPERAVADGSISFFGAIDPNEGGNTHRTNIQTRVRTQLSEYSTLSNQLYYTAHHFDLFSNFTFFLNDPVNGDQIRQKEKRGLWGYNGLYKHYGVLERNTHTFEVGLSLRADATRNSQLAHTKNRATLLQRQQWGNVSEWNAAAFIRETVHLPYRITLEGALRFDQFIHAYSDKLQDTRRQKHTAIVSPKINLSWQASNKAMLYLSAGRGFHSNDARVVVQTNGREALPAARGADLGIQAKPRNNLVLQAALWYLALDQEFIYIGDEGIVEPSGRTRRTGLDVSARYQPLRNLYLDADLNYAKALALDVSKGEDYLPLAPRFTSSGGITYKKNSGWNGSFRYRWMGNRPANEDNSLVAEGYFICDAGLAYHFKRIELMVSVQNLFDVRWKETQFASNSRLQQEPGPVTEIHFTPGTPFFLKAGITITL